ncbi:hypothetical protein cyc_03245 [Cyclospora cayetanensis]|uniref:Uncharacterized protein n=1 Tax=Cyclospora cayetanensis TaxID=88456 RepID=A0A1D3D7H6_9EIME|nr:hypothetical protein cyc_03245 [Cyclospora cayetanensis]
MLSTAALRASEVPLTTHGLFQSAQVASQQAGNNDSQAGSTAGQQSWVKSSTPNTLDEKHKTIGDAKDLVQKEIQEAVKVGSAYDVLDDAPGTESRLIFPFVIGVLVP